MMWNANFQKQKMDPIDRIAALFESHCRSALLMNLEVEQIVSMHATMNDALLYLEMTKYRSYYSLEKLRDLHIDTEYLDRCISLMKDIKKQARDVFKRKYGEIADFNSAEVIFNSEICFSYACKMQTPIGPMLHHFSNNPTKSQVVNSELALCLSPSSSENKKKRRRMKPLEVDLICYETM